MMRGQVNSLSNLSVSDELDVVGVSVLELGVYLIQRLSTCFGIKG